MSEHWSCPFCDSSEAQTVSELRDSVTSNFEGWKDTHKILSYYFPSFTLKHFVKLCNSCFNYVREFCKNRKLWLYNENLIHAKRKIGHFKGLRDIVNLKKKSSVVCRLCFKENALEDVIFIYLDNSELYKPGYLQEILDHHANDIDFQLTENPVICQECLNAVQTFDALYQMGVENQACKNEPDFMIRGSSQDQDKVVHVQLQKSKNNSLVLKSVTEEESAVNSLIRYKDSSGGSSNVVLNGWTMKKVFDIIGKPKNKKKMEEPPDVLVISDEEDTTSCDMPTNEITGTCTNNQEITEIDPSDLEVTEIVESNLEATEIVESNLEATEIVESNLEATEIVESNIEVTEIYESLTEVVENNSEITNGFHPVMTEEPHPEEKSDEHHERNENLENEVIEICDSDEEDTELPKILSVSTVTDTVQKHLPFSLDDLEEGEIVPEIIISMEAVEKLFRNDKEQSTTDDPIVSNCFTETDVAVPAMDVVDSNSNSSVHQSKETLEENLSDFLQFNKNDFNNSPKRPNDDLLQTSESSKKVKFSKTVLNDSKSYSSAFEKFALIEHVPAEVGTAWKFLRGFVPHDFKEEEFVSWFPYFPKNKKYYPSKKALSFGTVLEDLTGQRIYRCDVCLKVEREEINMENHFCQSNRGKKVYKCESYNCNFLTFSDFLIAQHKKAHMVLSDDEIKCFKCNHCDYFSSNRDALEKHITLTHLGSQTVDKLYTKCSYCFFHSENPEILEHHMLVRHSHRKIVKSRLEI